MIVGSGDSGTEIGRIGTGGTVALRTGVGIGGMAAKIWTMTTWTTQH